MNLGVIQISPYNVGISLSRPYLCITYPPSKKGISASKSSRVRNSMNVPLIRFFTLIQKKVFYLIIRNACMDFLICSQLTNTCRKLELKSQHECAEYCAELFRRRQQDSVVFNVNTFNRVFNSLSL